MDPISALILLGALTVASVRTVGAATTDVIAKAKGETPPSLEKWRKNQERKAARGERPEQEPSPWKRRWRNSVEYRNAKAAQRHQADMEFLRDHGRENVAKRKQQLERRAARRDAVGSRMAGLAASSWDAAKKAAEAAKNKRQQSGDPGDIEQPQQPISDQPMADVLDFPPRRDRDTQPEDGSGPMLEFTERRRADGTVELEVNPTDDPERASNVRGDPADPSTWTGRDRDGRDIQTGRGGSYTDPSGGVVHDHDTYRTDVSPERRLVQQRQFEQQRRQQEQELAQINTSTSRTGTAARDALTSDEANAAWHRELREIERQGHEYRQEEIRKHYAEQSSTNSGGESDVSANTSTEITDLDTAISFSKETVDYAATITATLSDMQAQVDAAVKGLETEASTYEGGKASLEGEGFNSKVTGRLDSAAEAIHAAVEALKTASTKVAEANEGVSTVNGEMKGALKVFNDQLSLQEQIGAQETVANRTDFYAPAR